MNPHKVLSIVGFAFVLLVCRPAHALDLKAAVIRDHGQLAGQVDDDHTQYQKESEKDQPNGYAGLDGSGDLPASSLPNHAANHTDGTDDIQSATAAQKGVATAAQITKLDAIEPGATADQTDGEIKTAYEANANTNEFDDAEQTKLGTVESNAKDDQSAAEVPIADAGSRYTGTDAEAALQEIAGAGRTTETVKGNADDLDTHEANVSNPHTVTKTQVGLGNVEDLKVNLVAVTDPGTGNDNTQGYAVGSRWINVTLDKEFVALDVTTAAAVWVDTTKVGDVVGPGSATDEAVALFDGTTGKLIKNSGLISPSGTSLGIGVTPLATLHSKGTTEQMRLEDTSATGNPFFTFYQATTRRSFMQHNDTDDQFIFASEFGDIVFKTGTGGTELERLKVEEDGTLNVAAQTNYETKVTADDDIPNKKYVDDVVANDARIAIHWDLKTAGEGSFEVFAGTPDIKSPDWDSTDLMGYLKVIGGAADDKGGVVYEFIIPEDVTAITEIKCTGKLGVTSEDAINYRAKREDGTQIESATITATTETEVTMDTFSPAPTLVAGTRIIVEAEYQGDSTEEGFIGSCNIKMAR